MIILEFIGLFVLLAFLFILIGSIVGTFSMFDDDVATGYLAMLIVIALIISWIVVTFLNNPEGYGYTKIETTIETNAE